MRAILVRKDDVDEDKWLTGTALELFIENACSAVELPGAGVYQGTVVRLGEVRKGVQVGEKLDVPKLERLADRPRVQHASKQLGAASGTCAPQHSTSGTGSSGAAA